MTNRNSNDSGSSTQGISRRRFLSVSALTFLGLPQTQIDQLINVIPPDTPDPAIKAHLRDIDALISALLDYRRVASGPYPIDDQALFKATVSVSDAMEDIVEYSLAETNVFGLMATRSYDVTELAWIIENDEGFSVAEAQSDLDNLDCSDDDRRYVQGIIDQYDDVA